MEGHGLRLVRVQPQPFGVVVPPLEPPPPPASTPKSAKPVKDDWIEFEVVDEDGNPKEGCAYEIELPDGRVLKGTVGSKGIVA